MSHTVKVSVALKDPSIIERARVRCGLPALVEGTHKLYSGTFKGLALQLPNWKFPLVIDTTTGEAKYDNYSGQWGKQVELDRLCQAYALELGTREFQAQGYTVAEEPVAEHAGDVRLVATSY
jgi:hypothetical protein